MRDVEITDAFQRMTEGSDKFTRRMAIALADMCMCEVRPLVLRLEAMKLLKEGSWDWFVQNGGFTKAHYEQARKECHPTYRSK